MAEKIEPIFNFEYEVVLTRGQTQKDALTEDLAAFTARFPWITSTYTASYQTDIDTAEAFPGDDTVMANTKVLTADVNASVEEGKGNLKILFLYAKIAYPTDLAKQRVFGQDEMDKARSDQEKMMNLLERANSFADKAPYKAALTGKGYTQVEIDALASVATNIKEKNRLQENAKNSRPVTTQDRVIVYNTVFSRMLLINTCAQVVFAGNPAKIAQYRAYPPQAAAAITLVQAHVTNIGTGENMGGLTVTVVGTALTDTTNDDGIVTFDLDAGFGDAIAFEVSGADIATQVFEGFTLAEGEENSFEIEVTV